MTRAAWAQAGAYAQLDSIPLLSYRLTTFWSGVAAVAAAGAAAGAEVQGVPDRPPCLWLRPPAWQVWMPALQAGLAGLAGG